MISWSSRKPTEDCSTKEEGGGGDQDYCFLDGGGGDALQFGAYVTILI